MIQQGKVLQKIRQVILSISEVANLTQSRVHHMMLAQNNTFPSVTYQAVDISPVEVKAGQSTYENHRIQFNAYANRDDEVIAILDHIRQKFDRLNDETGPVKIHTAFFVDRTTLLYEKELNVYYSNLDIDIHFKN